MERFSHRNGETTPPTVDGWFFYNGGHTEYSGLYQITRPHWSLGNLHGQRLETFEGQWWGPIVAPWDTPPPVAAGELWTDERIRERAEEWQMLLLGHANMAPADYIEAAMAEVRDDYQAELNRRAVPTMPQPDDNFVKLPDNATHEQRRLIASAIHRVLMEMC